jgi:hypothetical protein
MSSGDNDKYDETDNSIKEPNSTTQNEKLQLKKTSTTSQNNEPYIAPKRHNTRELFNMFDDTDATDATGGKPTKPTKPTITGKKEILGKQRCIYKKTGDRKEYVKYKGDLITVKDYKKIISVKKTKK